MTSPKRAIVNLFEMNTPGHITHGLWRLPGNQRHRYTDLAYWLELARIAEAGGFDTIFLADVVGAYDVYQGSAGPALREGLQIPNNDPLLVIPAMATVTTHLSFGVTFSTSYEPPFAFARRMSTLDHLTNGRVGWNIVTSYLPNAARNFGLDEEIPHETRYEIADEFMDVVYKLWEGSWEDGAVLVDRERGVYTDPSKVHPIDHVGRHFRVAGPHLSEPSRQRTPLLLQASASTAGIAFAAKHAEVLFTADRPPGSLGTNIATIRDAAEGHGRLADHLKFLVMATVITAETQAEVDEKLRRYRSVASAEGKFIHQSVPFSPLDHAGDITVRDALEREGRADLIAAGGLPLHLTIDQFSVAVDQAWDERQFFVAGTPRHVVDTIEHWLDDVGIDGFNLRQYHSFETAHDFARLITPELRRRGRLAPVNDERPPRSLRDRIFGAGDRLPSRHPAARFRAGVS